MSKIGHIWIFDIDNILSNVYVEYDVESKICTVLWDLLAS